MPSREHQLRADRDREQHAEQAGANRENEIERADVLVIGRVGVPAPPRRMAMGVMVVMIMRFRMGEIAD